MNKKKPKWKWLANLVSQIWQVTPKKLSIQIPKKHKNAYAPAET